MEQQKRSPQSRPPRPKRPAGTQQRPSRPADAQHRAPRPAGAQHKAPRPAGAQHRAPRPADAQHRAPRPAGTQHRAQHFAEAQQSVRRPADAQQRAKRPVDGHQRPPQQRTRRPQHPVQHPAQRRPQQNRPYPQRPTGYGSRSAAARPRSRSQARRRSRSQSSSMFIVFVILYIVIGSIVIRQAGKKAKAYLSEYEASRPQYKIEEYVAGLNDTFYRDMIEQATNNLEVSKYESKKKLQETMKPDSSVLQNNAKYSYKKAENFQESQPLYHILRNDRVVADVQLERSGWTAKYEFPEWRLGEPQPALKVQAEPAYSVSVTMPKGSVLKVNGHTVDEDEFRETDSELQLSQVEQYYMKQPFSVRCHITGLFAPPEIEVISDEGRALTPEQEPDSDAAEQVYVFVQGDTAEQEPEFVQRVEELTKAYFNYVINTNCDRYTNIAVLNNYLLPGSDAAVLMQSIIDDVYWNNTPTTREDKVFEVQHIKKYSDKVRTCEVKFDTAVTKQVRNEYIGTVKWTMVNTGYGWYASSISLLP